MAVVYQIRSIVALSNWGAAVSEPRVARVASAPGFWRVPLGAVGESAVRPAGADAAAGAVPFLDEGKAVDVGRSWTREACVREYGAPNKGTFGGRWAGALSVTPCRLQFRVPNRRWEAMYLLASCTNRNFLTVQFYRPGSGFPVDFAPAEPIPADGRPHLVRVPLRQDLLAAFADREILEFELTGRVENYRAHPEPSHYSRHGVGEPSGVTVHAITLKENPVEIDFEPEAFGNLFVSLSPAPSYTLVLRNHSDENIERAVAISTESRDGQDRTSQTLIVRVPARGETRTRVELPVKKYGWHSIALDVGGEEYRRTMTVIRPRDHKSRPADAEGFMFGGWPPGGIHYGLPAYDACRIAFQLGVESFSFGNVCKRADIEPLAKKYGAKDFNVAVFNSGRPAGYLAPDLDELMRKTIAPESEVSAPYFQNLFAEPGGIGRDASIAALCGEEVAPRTEAEEERYIFFKTNIVRFAAAYRKAFPGKKLLVPWGSPFFTAAYLKDPDTRNLMDGMAFDTAFFDRMPEGQLHACSLYILTLLNREWAKRRGDAPFIVSVEGPCVSRAAKESLTPDEHLRNNVRSSLILTANGVTRLLASVGGSPDCASYWGEQHYRGGASARITLDPHPLMAANATMVRLLRDCVFVRSVPTPSLGVFALEYRNVKTGEPLHALWCLRGKVPVKLKCRQAFDIMDNQVRATEISPDPLFVVGLRGEIEYGRQTFDAAETEPAADAVKVSNLASWTQSSAAPEKEYLENMPDFVRRHPVEMEVARTPRGLSVTLPEGLPDVDAMPFCTTLVPPEPVALPGRPRIIALDVDVGAADWGRVVYVLRDAKGARSRPSAPFRFLLKDEFAEK